MCVSATSSSVGLTLGPDASATLTLEVSVPRQHELGTVRASFQLKSAEAATNVPIAIIVSSDVQVCDVVHLTLLQL